MGKKIVITRLTQRKKKNKKPFNDNISPGSNGKENVELRRRRTQSLAMAISTYMRRKGKDED